MLRDGSASSYLLKKEEFIKELAFAVLLGIFIVGGLGTVEMGYVFHSGFVLGIILISVIYFGKKSLKFSSGMASFFLFLAASVASFFWSKNLKMSYEVTILFLTGGLIWLAFYNIGGFGKKYFIYIFEWFEKSILILGIFFGLLYIYNRFWGELDSIFALSLYLQDSPRHNHIGDLEAILLLISFPHILEKSRKKIIWFLIAIWSFIFLVISHSRSAFLMLIVGAYLLARNYGWIKKYKKLFRFVLVTSLILFLAVGLQKSILFSRDYYFQTLAGLVHEPLGVGMGNFSFISQDTRNHLFGLSSFSKFTHNIVLEAVSGMGILSVFFIAWLIKAVRQALTVKGHKEFITPVIFLALTTNFLFDYTYFIPSMLWLWFASLALLQGTKGYTEKDD